ncbi:MAG TPA: Rrf2 family transcriptional regulator [Chloroflexota bacterium]|nr:Rrf2 family transcriptional regulator [Chloroflexota bacterium]
MKISMRSDYGGRALLYLAERYGQGPIQSAEIAAQQNIPETYLEQLLVVLRRAGLVRSLRGPAGGHMLARPPRDIRLGEVIAAMEGPPQTLACSDQRGCRVNPGCVLHEVWSELESASRAIVDRVTLADLLERQEASQRRVMYHI